MKFTSGQIIQCDCRDSGGIYFVGIVESCSDGDVYLSWLKAGDSPEWLNDGRQDENDCHLHPEPDVILADFAKCISEGRFYVRGIDENGRSIGWNPAWSSLFEGPRIKQRGIPPFPDLN